MGGEIIMRLTKDQFIKLATAYKEEKEIKTQLNEYSNEGYFYDKHVRLNKYVNKW